MNTSRDRSSPGQPRSQASEVQSVLRGEILSPSYTGQLKAVFLDYEGTLNDSMQSGRLYAGELAGYLGRRFPDREIANCGRAVLAAMEATRSMPDQFGDGRTWPGYAEYRHRELRVWLKALLATAGLPLPTTDRDLDVLAADLVLNVAPRYAPTPGAVEAMHQLSRAGLRLYVSSGATTEYTARCLRDAGLIGLFADVFGPDKLDTLKIGAGYFAKCFRYADTDPARACVVDDSPGPLRWALALGARAIGVGVPAEQLALGGDPGGAAGRYRAIGNLGELTEVLGAFNV